MEEVNTCEINKPFTINDAPIAGKRQRKKSNYKRINNEKRQKLIEMVYLNDFLLKDAAKSLGINYSTAKTILRIFRIEKRVEKKNADEERELKQIISKFKKKKNHTEGNIKSDNQSYNLYSTVENNLKPAYRDFSEPGMISPLDENRYLSSLGSTRECCDNFKAIQSVKESIGNFASKIEEFSSTLSICYSQIQANHITINNILTFITNLRNNGPTESTKSMDKNLMSREHTSISNFPFLFSVNDRLKFQPARSESYPAIEILQKWNQSRNHSRKDEN